MCKILDDVLPIVGGVGGFLLGGPVGAALGGALGGFGGNYAQTHNFGSAALGGLEGGVGGYFGGGSLAGALGDLGSSGVGAASAGFDIGQAGATSASTLGGLESSTGGAGLFGLNSGTGTAIGSAANALGGSGLGTAGADALSGVGDAGQAYLGGLGGGSQGTGLGLGSQASSTADLTGITGASSGTPTAAAQGVSASPVANMSNTTGMGATATPGSTSPTMGSTFTDSSQAATTGSGAPMGYGGGGSMEGTQAAAMPGGPQAGLSTMFGPDSTAGMSPMGQAVANTSADVPGQGVGFGALGEGTSGAPGMAQPASDIPGQSIGSNYGQAATSAQQGGGGVNDFLNQLFGLGQSGGASTGAATGQLSPWLGLAKSGLGAYQQYAQQQANDQYRNSISNLFSPNSAYAQQMSQTLGRQDAAAGRNSQYGTRAVQLAAALTQAQAQALGGNNYAHAATATPGASMLNSLFSTMSNPQYASGMGQLGTSAFNGLSSLFGG